MAALLLLGTACSTKKNTAMSRFWQSFTTRYNVYFNGSEHYKQQLKEMETDYEDDYTKQIYIHPAEAYQYPTSPQPSADFTRTVEKMQKAIRLMQDSTKTLTNIAFECGFSDPKYMNRLFRQSFSCRPRQYREKGKKGMLEASFLPSVQKEEFLSDDLAMGKIKGYIEKKNPTC